MKYRTFKKMRVCSGSSFRSRHRVLVTGRTSSAERQFSCLPLDCLYAASTWNSCAGLTSTDASQHRPRSLPRRLQVAGLSTTSRRTLGDRRSVRGNRDETRLVWTWNLTSMTRQTAVTRRPCLTQCVVSAESRTLTTTVTTTSYECHLPPGQNRRKMSHSDFGY